MEKGLLPLMETFELAQLVRDANTNAAGALNSNIEVQRQPSETACASNVNSFQQRPRASNTNQKCVWCHTNHAQGQQNCPAFGHTCNFCGRKNHWQQACLIKSRGQSNQAQSKNKSSAQRQYSSPARTNTKSTFQHQQQSANAANTSLYLDQYDGEGDPQKDNGMIVCNLESISTATGKIFVTNVNIGKFTFKALLDTGSTENFISQDVVNKLGNVKIRNISPVSVSLANNSSKMSIDTACNLNIMCKFTTGTRNYNDLKFLIMPNSLHNLILGGPFLGLHTDVHFSYQTHGNLTPLQVCTMQYAEENNSSYPAFAFQESD
jgi:hypothetical protein